MSHGITSSDTMYSVRERPWHGLGAVLDEYPASIDEALEQAGLGWKVTHGDVLVVKTPAWTDDFDVTHPAKLVPANAFKANVREDTPARCSASSPTTTRSSRTATRSASSMR